MVSSKKNSSGNDGVFIMTNNIKVIDFNGVKIEVDTNTRIICLKGSFGSPGQHTLHKMDSNYEDYQIPTDKKARLIYSVDFPLAAATDRLYYSDAVDAMTNAVDMYKPGQTSNLTDTLTISNVEAPAGKYLNVSCSAARSYEIYILEEAA